MANDSEKVNQFEKDREQGLDRTHSPHAPAEKSPAERSNVNRSQTVRRDNKGRPAEDDLDEKVETPLTDEAMDKVGDVEAGHLSRRELAEQIAPRIINARDSRAYRIDQALKNEAVNDEVNARETDIKNEARLRGAAALDPDQLRESSFESSLADLELHTEEGKEKLAASRKAIAEARAERNDPSPVPGNISGDVGGGDRPENKGDAKKDKDKDAKK